MARTPLLTNNDEKNRYLLRLIAAYMLLTYYSVVIKVGMVGDSQIGKTSLMVKYVEGSFDEDYIQTLGTSLLRA
jgi:GTP-binding protein of the ras superfamily involved in termination of M-phase